MMYQNGAPLREFFLYNTAVLMFKLHMGWAPQYVCDLLNRAPARYESKNYVLPRTRIDLYKMSFAFSGSSVWNSHPPKMLQIYTPLLVKSDSFI